MKRKIMNMDHALRISALFLALLIFSGGTPSFASINANGFRADFFEDLTEARVDRKNAVSREMSRLRDKANNGATDPVLSGAFAQFFTKSRSAIYLEPGLRALSDAVDLRYVSSYGEFYDILFIAPNGEVFYSIKQEEDFGQNMFSGVYGESSLAKTLKSSRSAAFANYEHYTPSREPAAFFTTPVRGENGQHQGWMVFQLAINALNSLLSDYDRLGRTDEIYLLREDATMLTQSRLIARTTPLKLQVKTDAIRRAQREGRGTALIRDYRGLPVLSSYEQFEVFGHSWVIVAEIDDDEVLTRYYRENKGTLYPLMMEKAGKTGPNVLPPNLTDDKTIRVDINEFDRGGPGQTLLTYSVSTCTAITISLPGEFGYLGHIYPLDAAYLSGFQGFLTRLGLMFNDDPSMDGKTSLLKDMLERVKKFDIPPARLRELHVTLVAPHDRGFEHMIDMLIDAGMFISQIRIGFGKKRNFANVALDIEKGEAFFIWDDTVSSTTSWRTSKHLQRLDKLL